MRCAHFLQVFSFVAAHGTLNEFDALATWRGHIRTIFVLCYHSFFNQSRKFKRQSSGRDTIEHTFELAEALCAMIELVQDQHGPAVRE